MVPTDQRVDGAIGGSNEGIRSSIPEPVPVPYAETIMNTGEGITGTKPKKKSQSTQIRTETKVT